LGHVAFKIMLIRELIQLKDVRSIIQLGRKEDQSEVLGCFIWTEDIRLLLEDFSERLERNEGGGIFLKGHYGTGKSHLLAWLQEQAKAGWHELFNNLSVTRPREICPYKTCAISLIHFPSERSLESIVEENLGLEKPTQGPRPQQYRELLHDFKNAGLGGWVILFDELSEFLKSKSTPSSLAEDLRYLQFLAEFGKEQPLWVIGAIQEDIEGIGSADRETSLKLKDRFHLRWNLSTLHVEEILSARLIERLRGADDFLSRFFLRCQELWPNTFKSMQGFLAVYPLHPSTLDFLMGLGPLFSEHRGALRFTQDLLSGRWKTRSKPCLDRESHELLGPELLFDYFLNRFNENLELREYYSKAWVHLEHRSCEILDPSQHELALRMIKILLIATVDPRREGLSLEELQGMLMLQISGSADLGREFLQQNLLGRLMGRVNYLVEKDGRYLIDLKHQSQELLQRLLENRLAGLRLDQIATWGSLVELLDTRPLELRTLWSHPEQIGPVIWLNTPRKISISFGEHCPEADLRITLPGQIPKDYPSQQLTWVPRLATKEEEQLLLEAAAILNFVELHPQTNTEQQAKAEAVKRKKSEVGLWRATLEGLFKEGKWFLGKSQIHPPCEWHVSHSFETFLESPIYELLSLRHPHFRSVAPKIPYYTDSTYIGLIENFVIPGEVTEAQLKSLHIEDGIRGLAMPLGLVQKVRLSYRFLWEPLQSPLIEAFCKAQIECDSFNQARQHLAQGPWGLPHSTYYFLAWAALASGHYKALRQGQTLASGKISFHNIETIDKMEAEECLSATIMNTLLEHPFFSPADQSYSGLSLQRQLWNYTRQQLQNAPRWNQQWDDLQLDGAWAFALPKLMEHRETISIFNTLCQEHEFNTQRGLMSVFENRQHLTSLTEAMIWAKEFNRSIQKYSEELNEIWIQLFDEFLDELPKNDSWLARREDRRALIAEYKQWIDHDQVFNSLEAWIAQARQWLCEYKEIYTEAHREAMASPVSSVEQQWLDELKRQHIPHPKEPESACGRRPELELINKPYCRCMLMPTSAQASAPQKLNYQSSIDFLRQYYANEASLALLIANIQNGEWGDALQLLKKMCAKPRQPKTKKLSVHKLKQECQGQAFSRQQLLARIEAWLEAEGDVVFTIDD
jgi:hypothetical protein